MVLARPYYFFRDGHQFRPVARVYDISNSQYTVLYASRGGSSKQLAHCVGRDLKFDVSSMIEFNFDDIYAKRTVIFVIASDGDGTPVPDGKLFFRLLEDLVQDFRVDRTALENLNFAVIGVGSVEYGLDNFCIAAKRVDEWLYSLGANRIAPCMLVSDTEDLVSQGEFCVSTISSAIEQSTGIIPKGSLNAWEPKSALHISDADSAAVSDDNGASSDIEELGEDGCVTSGSKDMLTDRQRSQLEKEGYKIIGSHSAVKLCRWTKHHTSGRGGCYKHTFYGISSMNCMEATPSLACANKCVF